MLLDALSAAADEITRELAPGSVELRLRSGEPDFVVTPAPADEPVEPAPERPAPAPPEADEGATARINLRLPEQLKAGIEQAAGRERLSVNAWLVRVVAAARRARRPPAAPARRPRRPGLHRLGALTARLRRFEPDTRSNTMPTFDTPEPITATIDLAIGDVRISAGERGTTVVEVRPSDASER